MDEAKGSYFQSQEFVVLKNVDIDSNKSVVYCAFIFWILSFPGPERDGVGANAYVHIGGSLVGRVLATQVRLVDEESSEIDRRHLDRQFRFW